MNAPDKTKIEHVSHRWHGYDGWNTFTIRDAKTNVCLATVGEVDRYFQNEYPEIAAKLSTAYNSHDNLVTALTAAILHIERMNQSSATPTPQSELDFMENALKEATHN